MMSESLTPEDDPPAPGAPEPEAAAESWSFDVEDAAPDASSLGESMDPADAERMRRERDEQDAREAEARRAYEQELEEAGRQRRQNVRVMVKLPVTLRVKGYPDIEARTRDLSATGTGFATRIPMEVDQRGHVTVHFAGWSFTKEFVVKFVKPILAGRQVGVAFAELTEDEHQRVVKEVFAIQREQLQAQRQRGQ